MKKRMLCTLPLLILFFLLPLGSASARSIYIPNFADYAEKEIVKIETHQDLTIFFLPTDSCSRVLGAYAQLLDGSYGFGDLRSEKVDSIGYVWFASHETEPPEVFGERDGLEGTYSFLFAVAGAGDGLEQVILLPGSGFVMTDTGERFAQAPRPTASPMPPKPGKPCDKCDGTGVCQTCGGDMWFSGYKWVWQGLGGSGYESEYVTELCDDDNCYAGSCKACGGDGEI